MKKSIRLLSVLLAMVLCFTCMSVGVSAAYADYTYPAGYEHDKAYISLFQCGSVIVDKIDAMLAEKGDDLKGHVDYIDIDYDLTSLDNARTTVHNLLEGNLWKNATNLFNLGDFEEINFTAIENMPARNATGRTDVEVLTSLLKFLYDNATIIGKLVNLTAAESRIGQRSISMKRSAASIKKSRVPRSVPCSRTPSPNVRQAVLWTP